MRPGRPELPLRPVRMRRPPPCRPGHTALPTAPADAKPDSPSPQRPDATWIRSLHVGWPAGCSAGRGVGGIRLRRGARWGAHEVQHRTPVIQRRTPGVDQDTWHHARLWQGRGAEGGPPRRAVRLAEQPVAPQKGGPTAGAACDQAPPRTAQGVPWRPARLHEGPRTTPAGEGEGAPLHAAATAGPASQEPPLPQACVWPAASSAGGAGWRRLR